MDRPDRAMRRHRLARLPRGAQRPLCARLPAPLIIASAVSVALVGCTGGSGRPDRSTSQLGAPLSAEARAALGSRTCAELPEGPTLQSLGSELLTCLGDGPARALNSGTGAMTVVNLWASWCRPCVEELPDLQRVATERPQVRFVGINIQDEPLSAAALLRTTGVSYDQYRDAEGVSRRRLGASGLPVTVVFTPDGTVHTRRFGQIDAEWLRAALDQAASP